MTEPAADTGIPDRYRVGITRYRPDDAADLRAFQERNYGPGARQLDPERFAWLFERNPARSPEGPGLWICRRDGAIVGQQAEIPFELSVGGTRHRAVWAIDLMVEPAWRLRGVGPGLVATQLEGRDLVGGLNLSDKGRRTYERAGWTDLGIVPVYIRPVDARRALRVAPVPDGLRRLAGVAGPALRLADAALSRATRLAGLRLVPVDCFDDRLDEVWTAAAGDYPVLAVRDAALGRWRLDDRPDADRLRRYYLERRGRTVGYVVLRPTTWSGHPAVVVVDYLAPRRWVAPLLTLAAIRSRREGAIALTCKTLNLGADRALRAAGFVRRPRATDPPIRFMFRCASEDETASLVRDRRSWLITSADSDLELAMAPGVPAGVAAGADD